VDRIARPLVAPLPGPAKGKSETGHDFHWRERSGFGQLAQATGDRVPFDWRQVQLRQDGSDWKLASGGLVLADFGPNLHDAQLALSALRHYRFTELHRVGGEQAYLTWFS